MARAEGCSGSTVGSFAASGDESAPGKWNDVRMEHVEDDLNQPDLVDWPRPAGDDNYRGDGRLRRRSSTRRSWPACRRSSSNSSTGCTPKGSEC